MSDFYQFIRPLIFRLNPETAHAASLALLRLGGGFPGRWLLKAWFNSRRVGPEVSAFGLRFKNPVGLAAGYDKDGLGWRGLACLGFGHLELGTVTPLPQRGNPRPRVFRLVEERAVINRMGFPSRGADCLAQRINAPRPAGLVIGVNIGKNKDTPLEEAAGDYLVLFERFAPLADYLAVNVSSPNTPGLRTLQARDALEGLLSPLARRRDALSLQAGRRVPLLVKLAPDLNDVELDGAIEAVIGCGMDGVIVANTTIRRSGLRSPLAGETGGLSGAPLTTSNLELVRKVVTRLEGRLPVIASGGVMLPADVQARLNAGAVLVQLYTGLIYAGPGLVRGALNHLRRDFDWTNDQIPA
jgi:dihydroorotate dehydrogenase